MKSHLWILCAALGFAFQLSSSAFAQSYVREGSIGKLAARDSLALLGDDGTPLETWVGKQFIILPKPKTEQRYGYSSLRRSEEGYLVPTYDECAGQIATVVAVDASKRSDRKVYLRLDDDDAEYTAISATGCFPEIAAVSDLDLARNRWLGHTIWLKGGPVYEYDAVTGRVYAFDVEEGDSAKVKEIVAGWNAERPVRLIFDTKDGEAFLDIQVTSTNIPDNMWGRNRSSAFFAEHAPVRRY